MTVDMQNIFYEWKEKWWISIMYNWKLGTCDGGVGNNCGLIMSGDGGPIIHLMHVTMN